MKPMQQVANGFIFICTTWKVLDKWIPLFNKYYSLTNNIILKKLYELFSCIQNIYSMPNKIYRLRN